MWTTLLDLAARNGPWAVPCLLVMFGWLIPRWTHRERIADYKAALKASEATVAERERQISIMLGRDRDREPSS